MERNDMVLYTLLDCDCDAKGTLEPAVNKFEEKLGIRTELPSDTTEFEVDGEWIERQQSDSY